MTKLISGWRWGGKISRGQYFLAGAVLFVLKYLIDRTVAMSVFGKPWTFLDMLSPALNVAALSSKASEQRFYLAMLLIAVPFALVGIHLTLNRLRAAGLACWLVIFFFVPVVNLLYFFILAYLPDSPFAGPAAALPVIPVDEPVAASAQSSAPETPPVALTYGTESGDDRGWRRLLPEENLLSAVVVSCITAPIVLGLTALSVRVLHDYGLGLFIGMPFIIGLVSSVLHGQRRQRTLRQCFAVATLAVLIAAGTFVLFAIDGLICVLMMLPLAIPLALVGAVIGYSIQKRPVAPRYASRALGMPLLVLPILMSAEHFSPPASRELIVQTVMEIDAPPQIVWAHCVAIQQLPPPTEWLFRAGIACPVRTEIDGTGVNATRRCILSTGPMLERVSIWKPSQQLRFEVISTPPAMKEWSPWNIHPPHIENVMQVHAGEFRLIALPGNRTRVVGTSWYHHDIWPTAYWSAWSDHVVHLVHRRVLCEVKRLSEREAINAGPASQASAR